MNTATDKRSSLLLIRGNISRTKAFIILLIFQCLVLGFILTFCCIKYEVSDDFIMELMLSGVYTKKLDWHILFSNPLLGIFICLFYKINRSISWYFIIQIGVCFASYLGLSWVLSDKKNKWIGICTVVTLTMFTAGDLYVLPQFTKTAAAAIVSGCILFVYEVFIEQRKVLLICGGVLALVGTFIRFSVLYAVGLFILVLIAISLVYMIKHSKNVKKDLIRAGIQCGLFIVIVFGLNRLGDYIFVMHQDYAYYRAYNSARASIIDYESVNYEDCADELQELGISENDYFMLLRWNLGDSKKYSLETLKSIVEILNNHRQHKILILEEFNQYVTEEGYWSYPIVGCFLLFSIVCIILNWKRFWIPVLSWHLIIFYIVLFHYMGRCVYRVDYCFLFAAACLVALSLDASKLRQDRKPGCIISILLSFTSILYAGSGLIPLVPSVQEDSTYRETVDNYLYYSWRYDKNKYPAYLEYGNVYPHFIQMVLDHPENRYILEFSTTIQRLYYHYSPFVSAGSVFPQNLFWMGGVMSGYPGATDWIEAQGYSNLIESLLLDNVYYVGNRWSSSVLLYLVENGHPSATKEFVEQIDGFDVWKYHDN